MESDSADTDAILSAYQRLELTDTTTVQGTRGETVGNTRGVYEIVEWVIAGSGVTNYEMDIVFNTSNVISAEKYYLRLNYSVDGSETNFGVKVYNSATSSWDDLSSQGDLSSTSFTTKQYTLNSNHRLGDGWVRTKFIGRNESGDETNSSLYIEYFGVLSAYARVTLIGTTGTDFGWSVSNCSDINSDGTYDDVIVGAPGYNYNRGRAYIFYRKGYNDIVTADASADQVTIYNGTSNGWEAQDTLDGGDQPRWVFVGDANNDGYNDIVTSDYNDNTVSIYNGTSSGGWEARGTLNVGTQPYSVFVGDANNDGYNDIVTADRTDDTVTIYNGTSSGGWEAKGTLNVGDGPRSVFVGDANNDGYNDILTADETDDTVTIYNGTSSGWEAKYTLDVGNGPYTVFVGDANNDGYNDILTADELDDTVTIYNGTGSGWEAKGTLDVGNAPISVFVGDANNDGYNDIITADSGDNTVTIYNGTSSGGWEAKCTLSVGAVPWSVFVGDANNDGYNDIVTADNNDSQISIYNGTSSGGWEARYTLETGSWVRSVFIGDASNDVMESSMLTDTADVILTGEAAGDRFGHSVHYAGDINSDGDPDVIVGAPYHTDSGKTRCGAIYIYCGGSYIDTSADYDNYGNYTGDHFGWSVSFAGDLNKDGTDEVLVGAPHYDTQSGETPASASDAGKAYVLCVIIVIPEFNILTLPLVIFTIFIMCINRYYRSISNSKRDLNNKRRVKKTNKKNLKIQQRYNK
jgi:hypothetical protein